MTTMFKNRIVKGITISAMALCLFANSALAGIIAYNKGLKSDLPQRSVKKINRTAKSVPVGQVTDKTYVNDNNVTTKMNVVNNKDYSEAKYDKQVTPKPAVKTYSSQQALPIPWDQYQILARIIKAEAGGEPFEGQVAVAAVLLNRIRSGKFPSSISANVFRSGEFESVSNGYLWDINPTASSYKAALLALKGWDPTAGSLYFYNPAKSTSRWIWSRPIYTIIGKHYFAG